MGRVGALSEFMEMRILKGSQGGRHLSGVGRVCAVDGWEWMDGVVVVAAVVGGGLILALGK